jgi:hypothetical protein
MAKISKFDRPNVKMIHAEINAALSVIAKKHGLLSLSTGTLSFSDEKFTVRVTGLAPIDASKTVVTCPKKDGTSIGSHPTTLIGSHFMANGTKFKVTDYKPSRPKYPMVGENAAGTRYKFTVDAVKRGLIK